MVEKGGRESLVLVILNPVLDLRAQVKRSYHYLLGLELLRLALFSLSVNQHVLAAPPLAVEIFHLRFHTQDNRAFAAALP